MGVAEPEGVKLPCNDDMETERTVDDEEARLVSPGNSPPTSPVTVKLQVDVSKMAKSPNLESTAKKTKKDPPCDSEVMGKPAEAKEAAAEVPSSQSPISAPPSPRPSTGPNVVPSSPAGGNEKARQWSANELGLDTKRELPDGWKPGPNSVICGRGKECFEAEGNKRFRQIINSNLDEYTRAPGKSEKSRIVTRTLNIVLEASPVGAFVKFEKGKWHEVSLRYAREKVGAWFRDCLSHRYKSSSKAKHARKMAKRMSYETLVDPTAVFNFPKNFAAQIRNHEQTRTSIFSSAPFMSTPTLQDQVDARAQARADKVEDLKFFDIDDLALIPFDSVDC